MTTDTEIAKYANTLIQDMYLCGKQGVFKGYVNWFMLSYSNAVEARAANSVKMYLDAWGAGSTATITDAPKGTLSTGKFDLTTKP